MILTEKGSTRGTLSLLLIAALIFLGARFLVHFIETALPSARAEEIKWKPITNVLKDDEAALDEKIAGTAIDDTVPTDHKSTKAESLKVKDTTRKRFAVERLFPDNTEGKPLLFLFADEGSELSRRMEHVTLALAAVRTRIETDFYPVKINLDSKLNKTEYKLVRNYGAAGVPILSIRSSTGDELAYATGYLNAAKTLVLLTNAQAKLSKLNQEEAEKEQEQ